MENLENEEDAEQESEVKNKETSQEEIPLAFKIDMTASLWNQLRFAWIDLHKAKKNNLDTKHLELLINNLLKHLEKQKDETDKKKDETDKKKEEKKDGIFRKKPDKLYEFDAKEIDVPPPEYKEKVIENDNQQ